MAAALAQVLIVLILIGCSRPLPRREFFQAGVLSMALVGLSLLFFSRSEPSVWLGYSILIGGVVLEEVLRILGLIAVVLHCRMTRVDQWESRASVVNAGLMFGLGFALVEFLPRLYPYARLDIFSDRDGVESDSLHF
jgi:RsiW-degrading membrane proteinase PrsW (M82 family)